MLTRKQIALIHVVCKQLGICHDDRHRIQLEITGKRSLKQMDQGDFEELVRHFISCGARIDINLPPPHSADSKDPLIRKIFKCWEDLEGIYYEPRYKWKALREFIHKRFHVEHWRFLDVETAIKVIEAIKVIHKRKSQITNHKSQTRSPKSETVVWD